jgi:hypothetical protein
MTREDLPDVGAASAPNGGMSRRKIIIGGATLAAAGVAVGAVIPIGSSSESGQATPAALPDEALDGAPSTPEPIVVHLRNADSGQMLMLVGTRHVTFTDRAMADLFVRTAATAT